MGLRRESDHALLVSQLINILIALRMQLGYLIKILGFPAPTCDGCGDMPGRNQLCLEFSCYNPTLMISTWQLFVSTSHATSLVQLMLE